MSESYCQGLSLSSYCPVGIVHCLIYPVCETLKTVPPVLVFRPYSFIWSFNQHFFSSPSWFYGLQTQRYIYTTDTLKKLRFVQKHKTIAKKILIKMWSWRNHNPCIHTVCKSSWHCPGTETVEQILALSQKAQKWVHTCVAKQLQQERQSRQRREDELARKQCWELWAASRERMKSGYSLTSYTKIQSKWLRSKCETEHLRTPRGEHG